MEAHTNILVFNCGSSSQSFKVYRFSTAAPPQVIARGKAKNVATQTQAESSLSWEMNGKQGSIPLQRPAHRDVARTILDLLAQQQVSLDAIGHRFVHGGSLFHQTTRLNAEALAGLKQCFPLAPIHNPNSYSVIEVCLEKLRATPQYAVFDTAFHAHLPEAARRYAIPQRLAEQYGFRKYGFHGLSYQYVSARAAEWLGKPLEQLKLILCHLGTGGASLAALRSGHSADTSMGYSPLPGLVMSTRCGDIDAEVVLELVRKGYTADQVSRLLNDESGLLGLSDGFSSNLEEIINAAEQGNAACQSAFEVYVHRLRLYLGAYHWLLNGADAIVFTDDVGLRSWKLREQVLSGAEQLGVLLDRQANRLAPPERISEIQHPQSRTRILLIPTDEERVIAEEVARQLSG
jgi:acetate kinase